MARRQKAVSTIPQPPFYNLVFEVIKKKRHLTGNLAKLASPSQRSEFNMWILPITVKKNYVISNTIRLKYLV